MIKLLIIDDEPTLVEGLADSLSKVMPNDVDILLAYSSKEALNLLTQYTIDICISDIQMPGMNGLELLGVIEKSWPACRVIFLTAYSEFNWVQQAVRHKCCVDYILKTQGDSYIENAVLGQIACIRSEERFAADQCLTAVPERSASIGNTALIDWLLNEDTHISGKLPAIAGSTTALIGLFISQIDDCHSERFMSLILHNFNESFPSAHVDISHLTGHQYIVLAGFDDISSITPSNQIHSRFERIMEVLSHYEQNVNCIFTGKAVQIERIRSAFIAINDKVSDIPEDEWGFLLDICIHNNNRPDIDKTLENIMSYINANISDPNLSLTTIAEKTYYTPAYLSRLFKQKLGSNLLSYITTVRMEYAKQLLMNGEYSIKEVGHKVGFESPSYFSAFFKRNCGKTPVQYIRDILRK